MCRNEKIEKESKKEFIICLRPLRTVPLHFTRSYRSLPVYDSSVVKRFMRETELAAAKIWTLTLIINAAQLTPFQA